MRSSNRCASFERATGSPMKPIRRSQSVAFEQARQVYAKLAAG